MSREFKIFLAAFTFSLIFWWGINTSEEIIKNAFFVAQIAENPPILVSQGVKAKEEINRPDDSQQFIRNQQIEDLNLEAEAAISIFLDSSGKKKILFAKEPEKRLPIASLSKLMTAIIILENDDLSQEITISKEAVDQESELGNLKIGEKFFVKDLLYLLLMESSNDAAYALAEVQGIEEFVKLMNLKAAELQLNNTHFANPTGLDGNQAINYSTTQDLVKLTEYLLQKPVIWKIISTPTARLYSSDGVFHHQILNTNEFLGSRLVSWKNQIIGGKTGWTPRAKGCLLLVLKSPIKNGYLINVILGSADRFGEMEKMVNWIYEAYQLQ